MWVVLFVSLITSEATGMSDLKYDYAMHASVFATEEACEYTENLLNTATVPGIEYKVVTDCTLDESLDGSFPAPFNAPSEK